MTTANPEIIWAALRSTRADPPAMASTGPRNKTYTAALEQAEQMFKAAASIGVATQPILIFYGLSQGGRAVAAAAKNVSDTDYALSGHGIKTFPPSLAGPLPAVQVFGDDSIKGSFTRLSTILGSPINNKSTPVELGDLWGSLPEGLDWPLKASALPPLAAGIDDFKVGNASGPVSLILSGIPKELAKDVAGVTTYVDQYPQLAGYVDIGIRGVFPGENSLSIELTYASSNTDYWARHADAWNHRTEYGFSRNYAFPALGSNTQSLHPLMAWWGVLYALSMLARYHPESWAAHISIDNSKSAVAIERLLIEAQKVVPELILHTIMQLDK